MPESEKHHEKKTEDTFDVEELTPEEAENVSGGSCASCTGCGSACSQPPKPLSQA